MQIKWEEIENEALKIFAVSNYKPPIEWIKSAFKILDKVHMFSYQGEISRYKAIIRFMVIARIFHGFCNRFWDTVDEAAEFNDWWDVFGLSPIMLTQLYFELPNYKSLEAQIASQEDDNTLFDIIQELIDSEREQVLNALDKGFDEELKKPMGLLRSLYHATKYLDVSMYYNTDDMEDSEDEDDLFGKLPEFNPVNPTDIITLEYECWNIIRTVRWYMEGCRANYE